MYSYEDRFRAVKLYIKLGKRTGATILQLGYPTKNSLKSWHREHEQGHDFPAGYVRSSSKYSDEQKRVCTGQVISDSLIDLFDVDSRSKALGDKLPSFECSLMLL